MLRLAVKAIHKQEQLKEKLETFLAQRPFVPYTSSIRS
jgi:hypothetical protein